MERITGNTYITSIGDTDIGLYVQGRQVTLIDTGRGESEVLLALLRDCGLTPAAIINTHLHIDHIGSNKVLQEAFGCPVFCSPGEISDRRPYSDAAGSALPNPKDSPFRIIPLPGHSIAHQAVITPDNVCFLGDAIMTKDFKLPYHLDPGRAQESMERILSFPYPSYVLSHSGVYSKDEICRITRKNLTHEEDLQSSILSLLGGGKIKTEKLAALFLNSLGISREKQDVFWVMETANARIRDLQRQNRLEIRQGYARLP